MQTESTTAPTEPETMTDLGNARMLVRLLGDDYRWCGAMPGGEGDAAGWLTWDGSRWVDDKSHAIVRAASSIGDAWRATCAPPCADHVLSPEEKAANGKRAEIMKHARASESSRSISAMIKLAMSDSGIIRTHAAFDAHPHLLNTPTGTVDLETFTVHGGRRDELLTKRTTAPFRIGAKCPLWEAFMDEWTGGDDELVSYVQRALGYALTADTSEELFWFLFGDEGTGKGTLTETVAYVLGDYARTTSVATFTMRREGGCTPDLAALVGARFVPASELQKGVALNQAVTKLLTGGDTVAVNPKFRDAYEFKPSFKPFISTNFLPVILGEGTGIWRRVRVIPFNRPPAKADKTLKARIRAEAAGILQWLIEGCRQWREHGIGTCAAVEWATADYRASMRAETDLFERFITDTCDVGGEHGPTPFGALHEALREWCLPQGLAVPSPKAFARKLDRRGVPKAPRNGDARSRMGIALKAAR